MHVKGLKEKIFKKVWIIIDFPPKILVLLVIKKCLIWWIGMTNLFLRGTVIFI